MRHWIILVLLVGFVLSGCADSSTKGNISDKDQKQDIVINNTGSNAEALIYFPVYYATDTDTETRQETAGTASFSPKTALGYQGQGSLADGSSEQLLEGITNTIQRWQDNRKKDSENPIIKDSQNDNRVDNSVKPTPITPTPIVVPVIKDDSKVEPTVDGDKEPEVGDSVVEGYTNTETYELRMVGNNPKPFTWLAQTGSFYGGKIKFVWPNCGELVVPDATDDYSPGGHGQSTYFCGTKNKPEESNGKRASVFGPPNCKSKIVTIHYNNKGE